MVSEELNNTESFEIQIESRSRMNTHTSFSAAKIATDIVDANIAANVLWTTWKKS